jgi:hypothetical protein
MQSRSSPYPGFAPSLLDQAEKHLRPLGFSFHSPAFRGALFVNPDTSQAVLLDHRICDTRYPFAYTLYTKEQNALMHKYRGVFRFMADTRDDLADAARTLDRLLNREFAEDSTQTKGRHRHWHDIDPTMPEALFEQAFIDCYTRQFNKQNSLAAYGIKVFRWSIQGMTSTDNFLDEMRLFFGDPNDFLLGQKISVSRGFSLFHHQATIAVFFLALLVPP